MKTVDNKEIQLIAIDLDGTLINSKLELMPITKKALNILHQNGVKLVLASGRAVDLQLQTQYETLGLGFQFDALMGYNGGELLDTQSKWYKKFYPLTEKSIKDVIELMKPFDVNMLVYTSEGMLLDKYDEDSYTSSIKHKTPMNIAKDISEFWKEDRLKIMYRLYHEEDMPQIEEYLSIHPNKDFIAFKTRPNMVEFCNPRIDKSMGLTEICKHYNIDVLNSMACGDTTNDNPMLKKAGIGVCLLNGTDDTKACASDITQYDNDQDGLGRYLISKFNLTI